MIPPWGLAFRGEAEARCGEPGWETTADELARLGPASSLPAAWSLRVQALGAGRGGATAEAATLWAEAAKGFAALGMPFEAARCRLERAEVSPEQPHVEEVRAAHGVFVGVGARGYADRAARLLRSLGERVPSPAGPGVGGLTARQAAVAELVAQGLTNAEIAERLYISRRTVTTHLEHIYRELGIHTRTALTRYVIEGGLEEHQ